MQTEVPYDQALARKYPEGIAIALARTQDGRDNPITLGWYMNTSHEPPLIAISVGRERHSLELIRRARAFVLSYPSASMQRDALFHGTHSGRDVDKLATCGTTTQPATKIDGVLLADAVANFECELETELTTGDHVILVGRVVAAHMNTDPQAQRLYSLGNDRMGGVQPV